VLRQRTRYSIVSCNTFDSSMFECSATESRIPRAITKYTDAWYIVFCFFSIAARLRLINYSDLRGLVCVPGVL